MERDQNGKDEERLVNSKKNGTITRGGILKPKMVDIEAAMYVKPSPFSGKCTTIKSSITGVKILSSKLRRIQYIP